MAKKKLYAFLVAIDKYTGGVSPLRGCVNDMTAFLHYLEKQSDQSEEGYKLVPHILKNDQATKQNIIKGFKHFEAAKAEDVCVFFFCGHGSRIPTKDFWEAHDGMNEAIVCYDACLVDKEMACLIHEATSNREAHFLVLMDCCHSGGNTRDDKEVTSRTSKPNSYPVSIEGYYGFEQGLYKRNEEDLYSAPQGKHLNFAACRNYQTAKETLIGQEVRGAFTSSLIEALDTTQISLSYLDLESRVGRKIDNIVGNQRPQLFATMGANPNITFLGGAILPKNRFFVYWNEDNKSWELNAGSYHGVSNDKYPSTVAVLENDQKLSVQTVFTERSSVQWDDAAFTPDPKKQYDVRVKIGGGGKRLVAFTQDADQTVKELLWAGFAKANTSYIEVDNSGNRANWLVNATPESVYLTQLGNAEPVFLPIDFAEKPSDQQVTEFWKKVDNVLQWHHLIDLENPSSSIKPAHIQLELYRGTRLEKWWTHSPKDMELIEDWTAPVEYAYQLDKNGKIVPSAFALRVTNQSSSELFVSALFMSGRFGITNEYLPNARLNPGDGVWLTLAVKRDSNGTVTESTPSIGLGIDDAHFEAGLSEQIDYIKVIVAKQDFDTNGFNQDALIIRGIKPTTREGLQIPPTVDEEDWTTRRIPIRIVRPRPETELSDASRVTLEERVSIAGPKGFSAKAAMMHETQANRSLSSDAEPLMMEGFAPMSLTPGMLRSTGLSVIALENLDGLDSITPNDPLNISLTKKAESNLAADEVFIAFTQKGGQWYPLSLPGDRKHAAKIVQLDEEMLGDETGNERNPKRALKLFLYKITLGKPILGKIADRMGKQDLYQLAKVEVPADLAEEVKYSSNVEEIKKEVTKAKRILLFTHGYVGATDDHIKLVRRISRLKDGQQSFLQDHYDLILTFDYETLSSPISTIAKELEDDLEAIGINKANMEGKTFHVIAHSMGGIVTRWWIEMLQGKEVVTHYIQAGAPNDGAKITKLYDLLMMGLSHAINILPIPGLVKGIATSLLRFTNLDTIDDNVERLTKGSETLTALADASPPRIPYTIVSADTQKIDKKEQKFSFFKRLLRNLGYTIADKLIFKEPNDLVVGVSSSRAIPHPELITTTETIACDHFSFFRSPAGVSRMGEVMWKLVDEENSQA